jgi:hypothetical protein
MNTNKKTARMAGFLNLSKLTIAGGVVFWVTTIAISLLPLAAEYRSAFSKASIQTVWVASLPAGLIIGCCVSYSLLRFFDKIPTKNPILKSVILSFSAMVIIEVLSTFGNLSNAYVFLVIDTVMNVPRILALGIVIGYLYKRLYGSEGLV